ncbi:MAG: 23S rRNA (adenine(2503)-C(2))-methyltransferase RlmN [Planctomycetes bacterium]|nr:23S rRNA (adenine(2503)-C(2))-methyltransferase RlmN [Planctomycetota bacterium]
MMTEKRVLLDTPPEQWGELPALAGLEGYRVKQLRDWIFKKRASDFSKMTTLSKSLRDDLLASCLVHGIEIARSARSRDKTVKRLLRLRDNELVECVDMQTPKSRTLCLSTQVGCAMGCTFCVSGLMGFTRNLSASEILGQFLACASELPEPRIDHIVFMGMGEPLLNLTNVLEAIRVLVGEDYFNFASRGITVSTIGIPKMIVQLAKSGFKGNLAISLHTPFEDERRELVKSAERIGIESILTAAREYFDLTHRDVTIEYVLLRDVNDGEGHARALANLLERMRVHVNLIMYNETELRYKRCDDSAATSFQEILARKGVHSTIRRSKGTDVSAGCGQLRRYETPATH